MYEKYIAHLIYILCIADISLNNMLSFKFVCNETQRQF